MNGRYRLLDSAPIPGGPFFNVVYSLGLNEAPGASTEHNRDLRRRIQVGVRELRFHSQGSASCQTNAIERQHGTYLGAYGMTRCAEHYRHHPGRGRMESFFLHAVINVSIMKLWFFLAECRNAQITQPESWPAEPECCCVPARRVRFSNAQRL
jgi:hypothetical protein